MSMLINSYRFGVSGPPSEWYNVWDSAFTGSSGNWSNYTARSYFSRFLLPAAATKFRITFGAAASAGLNIGKAFIGPSRLMKYDAAPQQIFFSGSPGRLLAADETVISDEVTLPYDGSREVCISIYIPTGSGPNHVMPDRSANLFCGGNFGLGDFADSTASDLSRSASIYGVRKVEAFSGGSWKTIFQSMDDRLTGWTGYTFRSRFEAGRITTARPTLRFGLMCRVSDMFIGNAVETAGSFAFASTPSRLTFGGANASPATEFRAYVTDDFPVSALDMGKPILLSFHLSHTEIPRTTTPLSGTSSQYKIGNVASDLSFSGGAGYFGYFLGPGLVDEKY